MTDIPLKFAPFQSHVDISFWSELAQRKLNVYKLSEEAVNVHGYCSLCRRESMSAPVTFDRTSFDSNVERKGYFKIPGEVHVLNTLEAFKLFNRKEAIENSVEKIKEAIEDGRLHEEDPLTFSLQRCVLITYADLKKHEFLYWFAFPALVPSTPFTEETLDSVILSTEFCESADRWLGATNGLSRPFFMCEAASNEDPIERFSVIEALDTQLENRIICVLDPCHLPRHPSWLLRNILSFCAHTSTSATFRVKVVCLRQRSGKTSPSLSLTLVVGIAKEDVRQMKYVSGWEADHLGKISPRKVDLRSHFDPEKLADEAVGLNIRLMLWRAAPDLKLDAFVNTRCLLIGMGTLGCCVARSLIGWGISHLSLVDSGRVSYSNPVRQSLYEFEDCLAEGKWKAECAAEHLRRIHPGLHVQSYNFQVPMPGHPPSTNEDKETIQQATEVLHALVDIHDVVFLLTDNRESRWLPTVVGAALGKIVICAALGYDSYLIMRHGLLSTDPTMPPRLGCYFCNDIQSPSGTTAHLAIDQQCTVARPGLAPIASALAVEMLVSLLHHPLKGNASHALPDDQWGEANGSASEQGSVLGGVPHMMKGSVFHFSNTCAHGPAFHQCTACSDTVTAAYLQDKWNFVLSALTDEKYLQDLTGLTELLEKAEALIECQPSDADSEFELV